jgi:hypothetical protein
VALIVSRGELRPTAENRILRQNVPLTCWTISLAVSALSAVQKAVSIGIIDDAQSLFIALHKQGGIIITCSEASSLME